MLLSLIPHSAATTPTGRTDNGFHARLTLLILQKNLDYHLRRCPLLKQARALSLQPFYQKGINAGTEDEGKKEEGELIVHNSPINLGISDNASLSSTIDVTSEMKRNAVYAMTVPEFWQLITKIKSLHSSLCGDIHESYKVPNACGVWINREVGRKLPYHEKHVLQQASVLGNLEDFGLLKSTVCSTTNGKAQSNGLHRESNDVNGVIEFGAGRGYLTQMLADCYGIEKVFLVERKSYKLKADRSLRQKENLTIERLRIDIEDLNLRAVESLRGVPYLAVGKHLCGPATDLTLRCCVPEQPDDSDADKDEAIFHLRGVAIATCCHHLCQWKHYTNKEYFSNLGMGKSDFHAITWFTSWAVDADHGSDLSGVDSSSCIPITETEENNGGGSNACGVEEIMRKMSPVERAVLGFMCKDIIDIGRWIWMKKHGLDSNIVKYVPSSISPENHLLIGRR